MLPTRGLRGHQLLQETEQNPRGPIRGGLQVAVDAYGEDLRDKEAKGE